MNSLTYFPGYYYYSSDLTYSEKLLVDSSVLYRNRNDGNCNDNNYNLLPVDEANTDRDE